MQRTIYIKLWRRAQTHPAGVDALLHTAACVGWEIVAGSLAVVDVLTYSQGENRVGGKSGRQSGDGQDC